MPVPKGKQKIYGRILGRMINSGKSKDEAKDIADRAVKHKEVKDSNLKSKKKGKDT